MTVNDNELYQQVETVIDKDIRPYIEADGGSIQLKSIEDGTVFVQLAGACAGCPGAAMTLRGGVERILKLKISDIKAVKLAL